MLSKERIEALCEDGMYAGVNGDQEEWAKLKELALRALQPEAIRNEWIPVSERMPEQLGHYLGWDAGHGATTAFFADGRWMDCFGYEDSPITHWMQLPDSPHAARSEDKEAK